MVNLLRTTLRVKVDMNGLMAVSSMASGKITRWKVAEFLTGLITEDTKANTSTTRKKDTVSSTGPMVANTMDSGLMESNMDMVLTPITRDLFVMENGLKVNV